VVQQKLLLITKTFIVSGSIFSGYMIKLKENHRIHPFDNVSDYFHFARRNSFKWTV